MKQHKWHKEIAISIIVLLGLAGCGYSEKCIDGKVYSRDAIFGETVYQRHANSNMECIND